ncbi:MAG: AcrR family transcriptional regulator [Bradymonadia bacterium]|jgi:AcrR family transcriptional regulator
MTKHKASHERREEILSAAQRCFIRSGYGKTRVDDIAKEAKLSKGGVYFHFGSKREIFDVLHAAQVERSMSRLKAIEADGISMPDKMRLLGSVLISNLTESDERRKFNTVIAEMGLRDEQVQQTLRRQHELYLDVLTVFVKSGVERGEIRPVEPRATAELLKAIVDGAEQSFTLGFQLEFASFVTNGLQVLLNGLAPE